jgi:hypothetical protein
MADRAPQVAGTSKQSVSQDTAPKPKKKSLYQRYVDWKTGRNVQISDADLVKYTGKSRDELNAWAKDRPGVGGNQPAGKLAMGPTTGFGGVATGEGYGGWGPSAEAPLKFPPKSQKDKKKVFEDEESN